MANIAHSTLTGANLHEPKGVAAASADTVYVADGAGSGAWSKLDHSSLTTTGNPFGAQLFHVVDQQAAGANAGTVSNGTWVTKTLNTSVTNEITSASLASNQISLPAGTYRVYAIATVSGGGAIKIRLRNITAGTTLLLGTQQSGTMVNSHLYGTITLAGTTTLELQTFQTSTNCGEIVSGETTEVNWYTQLMFWKIA